MSKIRQRIEETDWNNWIDDNVPNDSQSYGETIYGEFKNESSCSSAD